MYHCVIYRARSGLALLIIWLIVLFYKIKNISHSVHLQECVLLSNFTKMRNKSFCLIYRGKNMSSMAFSMYLFTRGEGPLKTTQDLFTQAQYFGEEGVRLYQCGRELTVQVSTGSPVWFIYRVITWGRGLLVLLRGLTLCTEQSKYPRKLKNCYICHMLVLWLFIPK